MASTKPIATTRSATGVPTGRLAIWWLIASEIVIFGGVLVSYLMHRVGHPEWAYQAEHTNLIAGSINTFVLLTSSLAAVLAHYAAEHGDGFARPIKAFVGAAGKHCDVLIADREVEAHRSEPFGAVLLLCAQGLRNQGTA